MNTKQNNETAVLEGIEATTDLVVGARWVTPTELADFVSEGADKLADGLMLTDGDHVVTIEKNGRTITTILHFGARKVKFYPVGAPNEAMVREMSDRLGREARFPIDEHNGTPTVTIGGQSIELVRNDSMVGGSEPEYTSEITLYSLDDGPGVRVAKKQTLKVTPYLTRGDRGQVTTGKGERVYCLRLSCPRPANWTREDKVTTVTSSTTVDNVVATLDEMTW